VNSRFLVFVAIIQSILFFGHWLLYMSMVVLLEIPASPARTGLAAVIALLSVSFVTASVLSFRSDTFPIRWYYRLAAVWLGLLHCLLLASLVGWLLLVTVQIFTIEWPVRAIGLTVFAAGFLLALFALVRTYSPKVTRVTVGLLNLPPNWKGKRFVYISDLHLGHIRRERFAGRVVAAIDQLAPEFVCIGGDLFDGTRINAASLIQPLADLARRREVFFVTGNHELFSVYDTFVGIVTAAGMKVLDNEKVEKDGLQLAGISWPGSRRPDHMIATLAKMKLDPSRPTVLLVHSPDRLDIAAQAGIALQISGHTHRGQLWPFSLVADRVYHGFAYGLKKYKNMMVYTCSGTGTWGPPMRLGSPSEIVEITLT
jgi:hypothetical protein